MSQTDHRTLVALARWTVIQVAAEKRLSPAQRGLVVSEFAGNGTQDWSDAAESR